jgi:hypothetical protein
MTGSRRAQRDTAAAGRVFVRAVGANTFALAALAALAGCAGAVPVSPEVTRESSTSPAPPGVDAGAPPIDSAPTATAAAPTVSSTAMPIPAPGPMPTGGAVLVGDIVAPPSFDPKPTLTAAKSAMVDCYNKARQDSPSLRGKLTLRINVNEAGKVLVVEGVAGGSANDPVLVACLSDTLKTLTFPKPGGLATVTAPLVFKP